MSSNRSSSGIRNLRAMFENGNGPTSPEPRGRSPAAEGHGESPRPTPKVRTSFVAVEKSGQMAPKLDSGDTRSTAKDNNTGSSAINDVADRETNVGKDASQISGKDTVKTNGQVAAQDAHDSTVNGDPEAAGSTLTGQEASMSKEESKGTQSSTVAPTTAQKADQPAATEAANEAKATKQHETLPPITKAKDVGQSDGSVDVLKSPRKDTVPQSPSKPNGSAKPGLSGSRARMNRPSLDTEASTKSSPKSLATMRSAKSPKTPTTPSAPKAATPTSTSKSAATSKPSPLPKTSTKPNVSSPRQPAISSNTSTAGSALNRPSRASITAKPTSRTSPATKPRPKSPTRPARIPAAATAPTASSAAKTGAAQSTVAPGSKTATTSLYTSSNGIRRQPSAVNRSSAASNIRKQPPRPSVPPQNGPEPSRSRVSNVGPKPSAEGFLARMMRPTTSSASKTHEKTEVKSPPKRASNVNPKRKSGEGMGEKMKAKQVDGYGGPQGGSNGTEQSNNTTETDDNKDGKTSEVTDTTLNHESEGISAQG
ncbi:MAG: hypothetical protein M1812_005962 [Candelaria pacifica]|nr:MAG: hypothetical protein M1812_005962 [Candelaria pacifica]